MVEYNIENLKWKCQDCEAEAPPTAYDYMKLLKHQKGHHIRLIDIDTGTILAANVKGARSLGIDIPRSDKGDKGPTEPPAKIVKVEDLTDRGMELSEEGITFPITLPPVSFTLFDAAKAAKLVDEDMDIDQWIFECIQKRFELDYNLRLMLVPIGATE